MVTVQLHNHQHVACEWNSLPLDKDRKNVSHNSTWVDGWVGREGGR